MRVRVVDEAGDVRREAAVGRGVSDAGRRRTVPASADGPGVGDGVGRRAGASPCRASSRFSASPSESPHTIVVGLATTIFWNSGSADEVDCR